MSKELTSANDINEYVGKNIRAFRKSQKISLEQMADLLKVSYQQVQKYEKGINRVGADKLYEIASILNADINMFFPNADITSSPQQVMLHNNFLRIPDLEIRDIIFQLTKRVSVLLSTNRD